MAFNTFFWLILASGLCCLTSVMGCSSSSPYDDYKVSVTSVVDMTLWVVRKTDEGNKQLVVATEENAQLFCQTNVPWKKCWWKPPRNGVRQLKCEFSKGPNNRVTCPSFPEIHYDKQASDQHEHSCAIIVQNIQEHHEGNWRCEFEIDVPEEDRDSDGLPVIIVEKVSLVARGYRYI